MIVTVLYSLLIFNGYKWQEFKPIVFHFRNRYFIILGLYSLSNPGGSVRYDLERYVKVNIHISKLSVDIYIYIYIYIYISRLLSFIGLLLIFILVLINLCIIVFNFFNN